MHKFMRHAAVLLLAVGAVLCGVALVGSAFAAEDAILAHITQPPTWLALEFHSAKCEKNEGQLLLASHAAEGAIKGCWSQPMGGPVIIVLWEDGDVTLFRTTTVFPKEKES